MSEYIKKFRSIFHSPGIAAVFSWSREVHRNVVVICLVTVIASLCSLGFTLATKSLVDGAVSTDWHALRRGAVLLGAFILCQHGLSALRAYVRIKTSSTLQQSLQGMLVQKILSRDYAGIKAYHSGDLVNRLFSDISVVKGGVMNILPNFINIVVSFFGAAAILIAMDWHFVILMVLGGTVALILVFLFRRPMKERHKRMQEAEGALHASAQETLENIRLIKASVSEKKAIGHIKTRQDALRREQVRQGMFSFRMNDSMGLAFDFSWLFCMVWGCFNIYRGNLTYGSLAAMIQLIGRIQGPIANAVNIAGQAYGVISSAERLLEVTALPDEPAGEAINDFDEIWLKDVDFHYADGVEEILHSISWTIKKGDFMALTGMSGGGKTSLFQLLLGIYHPTSGQVVFVLGGRRIEACRGTRGLFAYVPQGNTLFSGTLRDNLTMFAKEPSEEEIMAAVRAACLGDLVKEIGLSSPIGERGVGLSEGQAQRVAIARAILSGAPILLLDEATSALDEETEAALLGNISAMRDKTCLIVTHRKAALAICDYELHMKNGRIELRM